LEVGVAYILNINKHSIFWSCRTCCL